MAGRIGTWLGTLTCVLAALIFHYRPELGPGLVAGAGAAWLVTACLIGLPYVRRWGGSSRDGVGVVVAIWALLALPALPVILDPTLPPYLFLVATAYAFLLEAMARTQGRYLHTDRKVPELEGEPRAAIEAVATRTGLKPVAILVASFPSYNAFVQGLRTCVFIVDRRASREMPPEELAAVVAHEAGHLRAGDTLLYLSAPAIAVLLATLFSLAIDRVDVLAPVAMALVFGTFPLLTQSAELRADRWAAGLTGRETVGRMLSRIHADRPLRFERAASSPIWAPFLSHPPLDVRLAALGLPHRPRPALSRCMGFLRTVLSLSPAFLALLTPEIPGKLLLIPGVASAALFLGARIRVWQTARRCFQIALGHPGTRSRSWGMRLALILLVMFVWTLSLAIRAIPVNGYSALMFPGIFLAVLLLVILRNRKPTTPELPKLPVPLRRAVAGALTSIVEGVPQQGLDSLEGVAQVHGKDAWFLSARGSCLLHCGRTAEAGVSLETACAGDAGFVVPRVTLTIQALLSGNLPRAREVAGEVCRLAPDDPVSWRLKGMVHLQAGDLTEAAKQFSMVCALKPADPAGLAGMALVALEQASPPEEVERLVNAATEAGPRSPLALLARARLLSQQGRPSEATRYFQEAIRHLDQGELRIWVPHYRSMAARWGIPG